MPAIAEDESQKISKIIPCALCGCGNFKPALKCEGFYFVRCKKCGLVQRNPQPAKEEIITRYSSIYGGDYLSYEINNEKSFLTLQQLALKDAGFTAFEKSLPENTRKVLDIGCATGAMLEHLRGNGWQVTGVEISPCAQYAQKERNLDVRNIPLEENNFPAKSFDAVLASHLIEHLNDPKTFLLEVHRILKDGGKLFITTPNISGFQAKLFGGKWRSAIFDHLYLFSIRTLKQLLKAAGFKTQICRTWGGLASGMAPMWLKKPADYFAKKLNYGDVMILRAGIS